MKPIDQINFTDPVERAISFALAAHTGQKRSFALSGHSRLPREERESGYKVTFIIHPLDVAKRVWNWGAATDLRMQGAVLHDVDEDTDYTLAMIHQFFGVAVAKLVEELTFHEDPEWDHADKREKKLEYMGSFLHKSIDALVIKVADRLCNVEDFAVTNPKYAPKYFAKAHPLFDAMYDRTEEMGKVLGRETTDRIINDQRRVERRMKHLKAKAIKPLEDD